MSDAFLHDADAVAAAQPSPDLRSLLALHDAEFVASAYLTLLRRPADADGLRHYTLRLRAGHLKLDVLDLLMRSREGRHKAATLPGLDKAVARYRLFNTPVLGRLLGWLFGAEGNGPRDRRLRAIEQAQWRQQVGQARLLAELGALRHDLNSGRFGGTATASQAAHGELVVQPRGQTPSLLSKFIKLERATADEVIDQLAELVRVSFEAEQLTQQKAA
jgi:hypothetical protein